MPSFPEVLYSLPTSQLQQLVQKRNAFSKKLALVPSKKHLVQVLSAELSNPLSLETAIQECDARELRLLQLLIGAKKSDLVSWPLVLEYAGGDAIAGALLDVARGLEAKGLAFLLVSVPWLGSPSHESHESHESDESIDKKSSSHRADGDLRDRLVMPDAVYIPDVVLNYIPASLSDRYTLQECLEMYDSPSIKRICDRLGLPQDTKVRNIEAIRSYYLEEQGAMRLVPPLNTTERDVLEFLVQTGGAATAVDLANATLDGKTEDFFRYDWQNRWKIGKERNAVDSLLARGLLYVVSYGYGYNLFLVLPGDLLRVLTQAGDVEYWTAPAISPEALPEGTSYRSHRHTTLLRDIIGVLGSIMSQEAIRTNTGHIHKTNLKNMMRSLSLQEERYASFLYAICRAAGLIAPQGERSVYRVTALGFEWLYLTPAEQHRTLVEAWRRGTLWGEMYAEALQRVTEYDYHEEVTRIRELALGIIMETANASERGDKGLDGRYYTVDSIVETLTYRYPLYLVGANVGGIDLVPSPANFVRNMIVECLFWLELVELALPLSDTGGNGGTGLGEKRLDETGIQANRATLDGRGHLVTGMAFRIVPEGAYMLGIPDIPAPLPPPREDKFIIQANGEVFVSPYIELSTLFMLLFMTDIPLKGGIGNTVMITKESIRRALDQGEKIADIIAFLQSHSRTGIPQNVEYLIKDVGARHGHIHIGRAVMYIQVDNPLLLKELKARKDMQKYWVRELDETVALLNAQDPEKLLRDLRKAGYLPVSDDISMEGMLRLKPGRKAKSGSSFEIENKSETENKSVSVARSVEAKKGKQSSINAIDWERISQEDGKPYTEGRSIKPNLFGSKVDRTI